MTEPVTVTSSLGLAQYLFIASLAYKLGIKLDYALKKYRHIPVGKFWVDMADIVNGRYELSQPLEQSKPQ